MWRRVRLAGWRGVFSGARGGAAGLCPRWRGAVALVLAAGLAGCVSHTPARSGYYAGPTDPMDRVVADINANSAKIPSIYALLGYRADLVDPQRHRTIAISGDGTLLYRRPRSLLLRGKEPVAGEVFALGSNDEQFWLKLAGDVDTAWWGNYANLGKPCCQPMPIRPDLVMEVLGIGLFDADFLRQPVPVMRFDNAADAYVFDFDVREPDRWVVQKEIWYDRKTRLPVEVRLYQADGRVVLAARLSQPVRLGTPGQPRDRWPTIASRYDLLFPDDGTRLAFWFNDDYATQRHGFPKPTSFRRPSDFGTHRVVQVDAACSGAAETVP